MPDVIIIGGPNGAGKSTSAPRLLAAPLTVKEFVNADSIAKGLSGKHPEEGAFEAGRIMLQRVRELANMRVSFAFETTLASKTFAPWIAGLRKADYVFHLFFLWLQSPDLAIARVLDRVRGGGHNVPEDTIRRRYRRGLVNFFQVYQPISDFWQVIDNSSPALPRPVAMGRHGSVDRVVDQAAWQTFCKGTGS